MGIIWYRFVVIIIYTKISEQSSTHHPAAHKTLSLRCPNVWNASQALKLSCVHTSREFRRYVAMALINGGAALRSA